MGNSHTCALAFLFALSLGSCAARERSQPHRPERYADSWGQFFIDTYTNPRQVSILRLGAGEARAAEYWVFEWAEGGEQLRPLYKSRLLTTWAPWSWRAEGDGRFLVTFDDRFEPQGSTDHCVVIYDFVRGESKAMRADDFVPEKWRGSEGVRHQWDGGPAYVDPLLQVIYTTTPARARQGTNPFVVIDLPSLSVRAEPPPVALPARTYCETSNGHVWEWAFSMGSAPEPSWLAPFALPTYLKGRRVQPLEDRTAFGAASDEVFFRLDPAQSVYVRCDRAEWREPPSTWAKPQK
ncbi:MAG: hypothetical protein JNJ88_09105 [Planctomycetes bacterium]|nr:hypothetical protein [Planctomycetota bacterium]